MEKVLLNSQEAAQVIGVSRTTVYELMASGKLLSVKIGARRLVPTTALDEYVTRLVAEHHEGAA